MYRVNVTEHVMCIVWYYMLMLNLDNIVIDKQDVSTVTNVGQNTNSRCGRVYHV